MLQWSYQLLMAGKWPDSYQQNNELQLLGNNSTSISKAALLQVIDGGGRSTSSEQRGEQ